eukprot:scaffold77000_cov45-Prasinocladus_malaysianus.AAC.4
MPRDCGPAAGNGMPRAECPGRMGTTPVSDIRNPCVQGYAGCCWCSWAAAWPCCRLLEIRPLCPAAVRFFDMLQAFSPNIPHEELKQNGKA